MGDGISTKQMLSMSIEETLVNLSDLDLIHLTANMIRNLNGMDKNQQPQYDDYKARTTTISNLFIKRFGSRAFEGLLDRI